MKDAPAAPAAPTTPPRAASRRRPTLHTGRAVFTEAYAVIPRGVMTDIVTSDLPVLGRHPRSGSSPAR